MTCFFFLLNSKGLLKTEPVAEEGEDAVAMLSAPETLTEEEQEELRRELTKVRDVVDLALCLVGLQSTW